eukprot:COSAG01_NODE_5006_length_4548_cov_14.793437_1_plen_32_part_10
MLYDDLEPQWKIKPSQLYVAIYPTAIMFFGGR